MALPVVLGVISAAVSVASTGYSIYSGETQKKEAKSAEHKAERLAAQRKAAETEAERKKRAARLSSRTGGRGGTLLTGGRGLIDTPSTLRTTLGGA